MIDIEDFLALTLYGDGRMRSPNTTCPKFSTGDGSSSAVQKSKLKLRIIREILENVTSVNYR